MGCSLEQDVLMTDTRAHRTTSSSRGLPPPEEPWPYKNQNQRGDEQIVQVLFWQNLTGRHSPCSAACSARDSRRGMMMSWKHRLVSSESLACSAIFWRLRHVSTTTSSEKPTLPGATHHNSSVHPSLVCVWANN